MANKHSNTHKKSRIQYGASKIAAYFCELNLVDKSYKDKLTQSIIKKHAKVRNVIICTDPDSKAYLGEMIFVNEAMLPKKTTAFLLDPKGEVTMFNGVSQITI